MSPLGESQLGLADGFYVIVLANLEGKPFVR